MHGPARSVSPLRQPHPQCLDRRLPRWKRWPVTAISDRACWTQLLQACPLQRPVPTVELHPAWNRPSPLDRLARFLIACHNSISISTPPVLPLECILFQHWRPSYPFPKLEIPAARLPQNEARGRFADRGQGLDDIAATGHHVVQPHHLHLHLLRGQVQSSLTDHHSTSPLACLEIPLDNPPPTVRTKHPRRLPPPLPRRRPRPPDSGLRCNSPGALLPHHPRSITPVSALPPPPFNPSP